MKATSRWTLIGLLVTSVGTVGSLVHLAMVFRSCEWGPCRTKAIFLFGACFIPFTQLLRAEVRAYERRKEEQAPHDGRR